MNSEEDDDQTLQSKTKVIKRTKTIYQETAKSRAKNAKIQENLRKKKEKQTKVKEIGEIRKRKTQKQKDLAAKKTTLEEARPTISPDELKDDKKVESFLQKMKAYNLLLQAQTEYEELEKLKAQEKEALEEAEQLEKEIEKVSIDRKLGKKLDTIPKPTKEYMSEFGFAYWLRIFMRDMKVFEATEKEYMIAFTYVTKEYYYLFEDWHESLPTDEANDFEFVMTTLKGRYPEPLTINQRRQMFRKCKQVIDRFFEYRIQKENLFRKAYPEKLNNWKTEDLFLEEFKMGLYKPFLKELIKNEMDEQPYDEIIQELESYERAEVKAVGTYGHEGKDKLIRTREVPGMPKLNLRESPQQIQKNGAIRKSQNLTNNNAQKKKKGICRFYQQGNCNKGDKCDWKHENVRIGAIQKKNNAKASDDCFTHGNHHYWIDCPTPPKPCSLCNNAGHTNHRCPYSYCMICGKTGHSKYAHGIIPKN